VNHFLDDKVFDGAVADGGSTMGASFLSVNPLRAKFVFGRVGLEPADEARVTCDVAARCKGERFVHQINAYLAGEGIFE
jgi:hypothetical protein